MGSAVAACGLQRTGSGVGVHALSCSAACGIVPDQGLNPSPLHGHVDSVPPGKSPAGRLNGEGQQELGSWMEIRVEIHIYKTVSFQGRVI